MPYTSAFFAFKFASVIILLIAWSSPSAAATHFLADGLSRFEFDVQPHGVTLRGLFKADGAKNFLNSSNNSRLFDLEVVQAGAKKVIFGNGGWRHCTFLSLSGQTAEVEQHHDTGISVRISLTVRSGKIYATFSINASKDVEVVSLTSLPVFLGPWSDADYVHYPNGSGIVEPAAYDKIRTYAQKYPTGRQSYQMLGLFNGDTGAYFATHDPNGLPKSLFYSVYPDLGGIKYGAKIEASSMKAQGEALAVEFATVFGLHEGDWYDAALYYRSFVERHASWWPGRSFSYWQGRPIYRTPLWLVGVGTPDRVVAKAKRLRNLFESSIGLHWYRWNPYGFDQNYPKFFPAHDGFAAAVTDLQDYGVEVMPYFISHLWDQALPTYSPIVEAAAAKDLSGRVQTVRNPLAAFAVMCPAAGFWQDHMASVAAELIGHGPSLLYFDTVAARYPTPCFDTNHGHPPGYLGSWRSGYEDMLTAIQSAAPNVSFTSEMNAEPYMHLVDGYLNWWWIFPNQQPIYQVIYGGQYISFGRSHDNDDSFALRTKTAQQLTWGEQIGWFWGDPDHDFASDMQFVKDSAATWLELREYFTSGRIQRPLHELSSSLQIETTWFFQGNPQKVWLPGIQHSVWSGHAGESVFIFVNPNDSRHASRFRIPLGVDCLMLRWTRGGEPVWNRRGDSLTIELAPRSIAVMTTEGCPSAPASSSVRDGV